MNNADSPTSMISQVESADTGSCSDHVHSSAHPLTIVIHFTLLIATFLIYSWSHEALRKTFGLGNILTAVTLLLMALVAVRIYITRRYPKCWRAPLLWTCLYSGICALSLIYAEDQERTRESLVLMIKGAVFAMALYAAINSVSSLKTIVYGIVTASVFLSIITNFQQWTQTFDNTYWGYAERMWMHVAGDSHTYRAAGPVGDPNFFALVLVMALPFFLYLLVTAKPAWQLILATALLIVHGACFTYTYSRSGFIALLVVLGISAVHIWRYPLSRSQWIAALFALIAIFALSPNQYIVRMTSLQRFIPILAEQQVETTPTDPPVSTGEQASAVRQAIVSEPGFSGRLSENIVALHMFADHPILGVGLSNYYSRYMDYAPAVGIDTRGTPRFAHNLYLEAAAETGVLGTIPLIALLLIAFTRGVTTRRCLIEEGRFDDAVLIGACILAFTAFCVASLFQHAAYTRYFWMILAIVLALPQIHGSSHPMKQVRRSIP